MLISSFSVVVDVVLNIQIFERFKVQALYGVRKKKKWMCKINIVADRKKGQNGFDEFVR